MNMRQVDRAEKMPKSPIRNPLDIPILFVAGYFGAKSKEVERFLKFGVVGLVGFVVDFATVNILQSTALPPTSDFNVSLATAIAFVAAITSNFTWNRIWTYPDSRSRPLKQQLVQFAIVSLIGGLGRTFWINQSYQSMGTALTPAVEALVRIGRVEYVATPEHVARIGTNASLFIGVIVVMFWNFFINRYWTYNDVD